jgi:hypothetical protein
MRRRDALPDPETDRGLRELDAALAGKPTADPDLTLLIADVAATRPEPDAAFLAALDARVHAGFPREAQTPRRGTAAATPWFRRPLVLGPVAVAALSALVVAVAISSHGGGGASPASSASAPEVKRAARLDADSASSSSASTSAASPSQSGTFTTGGRAAASQQQALSAASSSLAARKVERAASLTLTPAPADVQDTTDGVVRTTQAAGGYVQNSNVTTRANSGSAQFTLRIPAAHLDAALAQLSKLAHVGALDQSSDDITAQTSSAADHLAEATAERKALLRALGAATTTERIASLKARLADNRRAIAARRAALTTQQRRAQLATVAVDVEGRRGAAARHTDDSGGPWSPGDALHDAGRVLAIALGVALIALAVLLPLALLAALGALGARQLRRLRREVALDASAT